MEFGATSEDVARIIHGHPTLSESMYLVLSHSRKCNSLLKTDP